MDSCDERGDCKANKVKARILSVVSALHAVDARYHKDCRDNFMAQHSVYYAANDTGANVETDEAFLLTAAELESDMIRIRNSVELYDLYVSKGGTVCSRTLVVKLCEHFGSDLLLLTGSAVANILVFKSKASTSLRLIARDNDDDEIDIALDKISKCIVQEAKEMDIVQRHYQARIYGQAALDHACPTILSFLAKVSDKLAYTMPAAIIGNIITGMLGLGLGLALRPENGGLGLGSSGLSLGLDTKALALPISRPRPGSYSITMCLLDCH